MQMYNILENIVIEILKRIRLQNLFTINTKIPNNKTLLFQLSTA